ncbi:MAG TPA: hypothetical protein VIJ57_04965 [Hanamia sp.]
MTDILIPLMHQGSKHDNIELRFCLRSIEKHLKDYGNIYIIGEKPDWIKNIIHIPFEDSTDNKQRAWNIYRKILAGCKYRCEHFEQTRYLVKESIDQLSDNFLYVNDDHYLLTDYKAGEFPYYHRGLINLKSLENNHAQVEQSKNTYKIFGQKFYDFDVHCPILFNKNLFEIIFNKLNNIDYGYLVKSLYMNHPIDTTYWIPCEDLKFRERIMMKESIYQALEGRDWFSIGDRALLEGSKMIEVLNELYPKKSIYEND